MFADSGPLDPAKQFLSDSLELPLSFVLALSAYGYQRSISLVLAKIRVVSPFVGGGFGAKLWIRSDAILAALGARAAGRPVKVALARPQVFNATVHRPATIQRIRIGAQTDGTITAIAHESWSGNLPGGRPETATEQTRLLYAGATRLTGTRRATRGL